MPYGVVAPNFTGVYDNYATVERVKALYPYAKFRRFMSEEEAWTFVRRNTNRHELTRVYHYGDIFNLYVDMTYYIYDNTLYYNFDTSHLGNIRVSPKDNVLIEYRNNKIKAKISNIHVNPRMISAHLCAIYNGLDILGDMVDVNINLPDHSIYYALNSYSGENRTLNRWINRIKDRRGNLAYTLNF